jgi:hypothetical protein
MTPNPHKVRDSQVPMSREDYLRHHLERMVKIRQGARRSSDSGETASSPKPESADVVRWLLSSLQDPSVAETKVPALAEDLRSLRDVVSGITEAHEQRILTDSEVESILQYVLGGFIERRFNTVLHRISMPAPDENWFFIAARKAHEPRTRRIDKLKTSAFSL